MSYSNKQYIIIATINEDIEKQCIKTLEKQCITNIEICRNLEDIKEVVNEDNMLSNCILLLLDIDTPRYIGDKLENSGEYIAIELMQLDISIPTIIISHKDINYKDDNTVGNINCTYKDINSYLTTYIINNIN